MKELIEKYEEIKKQMIDSLGDELRKLFDVLFEKYPDLSSVTWTQYAPYFNDGDPCTFHVREVGEVSFVKDGDVISYNPNYYEWEDDSMEQLALEKFGLTAEAIRDIAGEFEDITFSIPEDIMESLGHGKVIVTRNSLDVEDYDHD